MLDTVQDATITLSTFNKEMAEHQCLPPEWLVIHFTVTRLKQEIDALETIIKGKPYIISILFIASHLPINQISDQIFNIVNLLGQHTCVLRAEACDYGGSCENLFCVLITPRQNKFKIVFNCIHNVSSQ